ncbi:MAG: hypothetical protein F2563_05115 [Actinobacteria bacterium]|jgi:hypothetical protein|nr:hypothetical protein [Actinomycetota bacterium]
MAEDLATRTRFALTKIIENPRNSDEEVYAAICEARSALPLPQIIDTLIHGTRPEVIRRLYDDGGFSITLEILSCMLISGDRELMDWAYQNSPQYRREIRYEGDVDDLCYMAVFESCYDYAELIHFIEDTFPGSIHRRAYDRVIIDRAIIDPTWMEGHVFGKKRLPDINKNKNNTVRIIQALERCGSNTVQLIQSSADEILCASVHIGNLETFMYILQNYMPFIKTTIPNIIINMICYKPKKKSISIGFKDTVDLHIEERIFMLEFLYYEMDCKGIVSEDDLIDALSVSKFPPDEILRILKL